MTTMREISPLAEALEQATPAQLRRISELTGISRNAIRSRWSTGNDVAAWLRPKIATIVGVPVGQLWPDGTGSSLTGGAPGGPAFASTSEVEFRDSPPGAQKPPMHRKMER